MESTNNSDNTNRRIGKYLIQNPLGKGEFSHVYLAQDPSNGNRPVAIKLFDSKEFSSQEEKESFFKSFNEEVEILKKLSHDYILKFFDANIQDDTPYLVLEYAPKGSLRERLKQHVQTPLPLQQAITILEQIGKALQYAHQMQVIHRDLKPENILFNASDDALLADFGSATKQDTVYIATKPIGIRPYMSPEELQGQTFIESDQYALGIIAYELFTGYVPFSRLEEINTEQPKSLRDCNPRVPDYIDAAVLKAIEKQRNNRHEDVSHFIASLQAPTAQTPELTQKSVNELSKQIETFDVFLSYSEEDEKWVENLAKRLKNEKGYNIWFKKWKMIPGRPKAKTIEVGFIHSKCYAICIGAKAPAGWVEKELDKALNRQAKDPSFGVIPIYLPGVMDTVPERFLETITSVDFRGNNPAYTFYLLVCGIEGIAPESWEPEPPSLVEIQNATESELRQLQRFERDKLVTAEEASVRRSQILQRPLTNVSIESRLDLIQYLLGKGLITAEAAEEKIRQITNEI